MSELQKKIKRLELEIWLDELTLAQNYSNARDHMRASEVLGFTVVGSLLFGFLIFNKNQFISGIAKKASQGVQFLADLK